MIPPLDWAERGRELAGTLDGQHAIVIIGNDPIAAAEVALGIGRVQALHRRVAIGDLIGDVPPLQALVSTDDPHGLVDSFLFGVSLNRIAQQVPDAGELFIMPSGTSPIDSEELFPNPRWGRLVAGFREVGALLVLVASADAPRLRALVDACDGAVIVGDVVPADISVAQSLAWLRLRRSGPTSVAGATALATPAPLATIATAMAARQPARGGRRTMVASVAGVLLTAAIASAAFWFARRPFASSPKPQRGVNAVSADANIATAGSLATDSLIRARIDSARRDSARVTGGSVPVDSFPLLQPVNPEDSASASAYAVRLEETFTYSGAILDLRGRFETVPAGTYEFELRTRYYQLVAGAYTTRTGAESLLVQLRARKILAPGIGSIAKLPFAFLVQAEVPSSDVSTRLERFAARGLPVYALRQESGAAHLYFGAYETPRHAALAVPSVKGAGLTPALVYRMGRVF